MPTAKSLMAPDRAAKPGSCSSTAVPRVLAPAAAPGQLPPVPVGVELLLEAVNTAKHLLAGALSAVTTRTCCAPLERVKMECILQQQTGSGLRVAWGICKSEGLLGLWRGNGLNILRTAPHKALNYFGYDAYRKAFERAAGQDGLGNRARLCAGALAGTTATLLCFPLDVLRTRIMAAPRNSQLRSTQPLAVLAHVARREGLAALWVGVLPALLAMAPSGAIYFGLFDALKRAHLHAEARRTGMRPAHLDLPHSLLFGALAGMAAESSVYPLEVIRRRMQTTAAAAAAVSASHAGGGAAAAAVRGANLAAFRQAALEIWSRDRLRGLYSGIIPNTVQVLPSAALSYWAYDTFKHVLEVDG